MMEGVGSVSDVNGWDRAVGVLTWAGAPTAVAVEGGRYLMILSGGGRRKITLECFLPNMYHILVSFSVVMQAVPFCSMCHTCTALTLPSACHHGDQEAGHFSQVAALPNSLSSSHYYACHCVYTTSCWCSISYIWAMDGALYAPPGGGVWKVSQTVGRLECSFLHYVYYACTLFSSAGDMSLLLLHLLSSAVWELSE